MEKKGQPMPLKAILDILVVGGQGIFSSSSYSFILVLNWAFLSNTLNRYTRPIPKLIQYFLLPMVHLVLKLRKSMLLSSINILLIFCLTAVGDHECSKKTDKAAAHMLSGPCHSLVLVGAQSSLKPMTAAGVPIQTVRQAFEHRLFCSCHGF